jgi:hypothetical protein
MTTALIPERAARIDSLILKSGGHRPPTDGDIQACIMEAVAWVAGEPWSDHPQCASPTIAAFMRRWNDDLGDTDRQALKPYITRLVGSKGTKAQEDQRGWMAADWMVHFHLPLWLRAAGLDDQAAQVEALPTVTSRADWLACGPTIDAVRDVTWPLRDSWSKKIRGAVKAELEKRGLTAVAAAVAVAAAAADAVAVAAAAAVAAAVARWSHVYWAIRDAVRARLQEVLNTKLAEPRAAAKASAVDLLERMLAVTNS